MSGLLYYCKRCRTGRAPLRNEREAEKVARFRTGYVGRQLECRHWIAVTDLPLHEDITQDSALNHENVQRKRGQNDAA